MEGNDTLLDAARDAGVRLAEAERAVLLARADYHTAIRRLHLAGASLRDIAHALSLSHQRVQQVVSAAGGSWWQAWRRRASVADAICSWCDRPPKEVAKLIAGPKVYICDACVGATERAIGAAGSRGKTRLIRQRCAFCGRSASARRTLAVGPPHVCSDCLRVCREILDSRAP